LCQIQLEWLAVGEVDIKISVLLMGEPLRDISMAVLLKEATGSADILLPENV
jgi:hypothetical protein